MSNPSFKSLVLNRRRVDKQDSALSAILEFQWPSTAIVNAPIPRSARGIVWIITCMVVTLVAVAGMIPVDQVVTAKGIVVSQSPTIVVQPSDTSIVRGINVHEGQRVRAGDVLARLDPTFAAADLAALATQVTSLKAQVSRLQAEAADKPFAYTGIDPNWLLQAAIYAHRIAEFDSKMDSFRHKADELASVISRAGSDAAAFRERVKVAQTVEDMRKQLEALQAGSKLQLLLATDNRAEMARSLAYAEQTGEGARRDHAAVESDRDAFVQGWRADVSQKLVEISGKLSDAREQFNKATLRRQLVELRSERDAIVQSVAKVSVGSVLQSGQQFITLVPADAPLEVEANVVGTAQDEARNPTSAVPVATTTADPFYRSRIAIDRVALHDVPDSFQVTPGMPVTADIKVGKRTVLKYLLGMVVPIAHEAMREP